MPETLPVSNPRRRTWVIPLVLAGVVLAIYGQVGWYQAVGYEDRGYIFQQEKVARGLTMEGVRWAFQTIEMNDWQPMVWLSYMLDVSLFGFGNVAAHHLVNVLFHAANTVLLYLVLKRMTRQVWPSAAVAILFAVHPLHVESVAWIAERKDVLSTFFGFLAIGAYVRYTERPSLGRYLPVFLCLALGLISKPMLVTLPFVLFLMDFWPLGRTKWGRAVSPDAAGSSSSGNNADAGAPVCAPVSIGRMVLEKVPLLALAAVSCVVTYWAHAKAGALLDVPFGYRLSTVVMAYVSYVSKTFWPTDLAVVYPYDVIPSLWQVLMAAAGLIMTTVVALLMFRRRPYLAVGWLWFLGTLVPVIGLVQVGLQTMADRYTYIPLTGLFIMIAWTLADLVAARPRAANPIRIVTGVALILLAVLSFVQAMCWRNSLTLFRQATMAVDRNYVAENFWASALLEQNQFGNALPHALRSVNYKRDFAEGHYTVGLTLWRIGENQKAEVAYREALKLRSNIDMAHVGLANVLTSLNHYDEAIAECRTALAINPSQAAAEEAWGKALQAKGQLAESQVHYKNAVTMAPGSPDWRLSLALSLLASGNSRGAVDQLRQAVRIDPMSPYALNALAWVLATDPDPAVRNGQEAVTRALQACNLTEERSPSALDTLAAAYAEAGRFPEAIEAARTAETLAVIGKQKDMVDKMHSRLELYRAGKPYHTEPGR
jgi:protein O-mannosyl-transferase